VTIECQDRWKGLEKYSIREQHPLDGMKLKAAIEYLAGMPGYALADMDVEDFDFTIEPEGDRAKDQFTVMLGEGDSPAKWLLELQTNYCADAFMGWVPTATGAKFKVRSLDTLNAAVPEVWIYSNQTDAVTIGSYPYGTPQAVYRSFHEEYFEPEANEVIIYWEEYKTGHQDRVIARDYGSRDPAVAVASRPDNWLGEPRFYGIFEPKLIVNKRMAEWACRKQIKLLSTNTRIAEFDTQMILKPDGTPLWRGDTVCIHPKGVYRIHTLKTDFVTDAASMIWRPTHYTAIWVGEVPEIEEEA